MNLRIAKPGQCWWCGAAADSGEHRFKKSDIVREHGPGGYRGDATLSRVTAGGTVDAQGPKSDVFKFNRSLCQACNNARSQPFDRAYDSFIEHLWANEQQVLRDRTLDLATVWPSDWRQHGQDVLRYFVKHACCRIAEISTAASPTAIPQELVDFLDGGAPPACLSCELTIEPVQVRLDAQRLSHPLGARWLGTDDITGDPSSPCSYQSRLRYGPMTCFWRVDVGNGNAGHAAFLTQQLALPVTATQFDVGFEWAMTCGPHLPTSVPAGRTDTPPLAADHNQLSVVRAFMAGTLDFDFALRYGGPIDEQINTYVGLPHSVDPAAEIMRARELCACLPSWIQGRFDQATVARAVAQPVPLDVRHLNNMSQQIQTMLAPESPPPKALAHHFGSMSLLKFAAAVEAGVTTREGEEMVIESMRFAGCCLAASGEAHAVGAGAYGAALSR